MGKEETLSKMTQKELLECIHFHLEQIEELMARCNHSTGDSAMMRLEALIYLARKELVGRLFG